MKKIAEDIFRQRLLIEGYFQISVDKQVMKLTRAKARGF